MNEEFLDSLDSTVASLREWDPSPILIPLSIDNRARFSPHGIQYLLFIQSDLITTTASDGNI